jgi:hypothetical protein
MLLYSKIRQAVGIVLAWRECERQDRARSLLPFH